MNRSIIRFQSLRWFAALFSVAFTMGLLASSLKAQTSVTDGRTPSGMAPGAPAGSYALSGLDDINLFNGNLNFNIPLITIGGRGSAGYTMTFRPNENRFKWRVVHNIQKSCNQNGCTVIAHYYYPSENWWATLETQPGYRPGILIGRRSGEGSSQPGGCPNGTSVWSSTLTRLTFSTADGTEYELRDQLLGGQPQPLPNGTCGGQAGLRGKVFVTGDGTAVTFISDTDIYDSASNPQTFYPSGYLLFRDGTRYRIDTGVVSWIRDRNGNRVSFSPGTITDSLNRVITYSYGEPDVITLKGFGGATRTIQVSHASLSSALRPCRPDPGYQCFSIQTYKQLFPGSDGSSVTSFNPSVVSALTLPDGRQYRFYYNSYAELARVDLPTGGTIEYDYAAGPGGDASGLTGAIVGDYIEKAIYRRVVERRVYADGQILEGRTTYSTDTNPTVVDQLKPTGELLSRSKHYFHGDPRSSFFLGSNSYGLWNVGREYKTQFFSNDGVTELRRSENNWQQGCAVSAWSNLVPNNPRIAETISTLEPSGANRVSKQVFGYDCYNNLTDKYEYDFGNGVPAANYTRRTHMDYLTVNPINGSSYDTLNPSSNAPDINLTYHLRSLAKQVSIYDAGGVERARSTIEYDNYVLDGSDCAHSFHCPQLSRSNVSGFDSAFTTSYTARGNATSSTTYLLSNGVATGSISAYSHYDVAGNVVRSIDPRSTPSNIIATTIEYDDRFGTPNGEARSNSAPVELGGQSTFSFASRTVNPLGHQSYIQRDYYLGQAVDVEDANGIVSSSYFNDALDRPTQVVRAVNGDISVKSQSTFVYNDAEHLITTTSDQATHPDNLLKTQLVYDSFGRTIETRQYESGANYISVQTQYDAFGRAYKVSNPFRPLSEDVAWTITGFDALGRVISVTTPDSAVVKTAYDGNRVLVADQNSSDELRRKRVSVTDGLGRLKEVWEITAADSATESVTFPGYADVAAGYVTRYEYDTLDNLTSVSQRVGVSGTNQVRLFEYDSLKRLTSANNPESGTIGYQYDDSGNLVVKTDARVSTHFEYDAINRLKRRWYNLSSSVLALTHNDPALPPSIGATNEVRFYYDSQTLPAGAPSYARGSATGRLVAQTYGTASNGDYFGYDAVGRPTVKIQQTGTVNYQISAGYNLAGGITSLTYPSGHAISNLYDAAGRLTTFSGNLGDGSSRTYSNEIIYKSFGSLAKEKFGTSSSAIYNKLFYNVRGQLAEIRASTSYTGPTDYDANRGAIVNSYSDSCAGVCSGVVMTDNNGNLKKQQIVIPAQATFVQEYSYDSLNRLQSARELVSGAEQWKQQFSYDRWGNRTINTGVTYGAGINNKAFTVNSVNNRLGVPSLQSGLMEYDAVGNLTNDTYTGAGNRTYDADNKITSAWGGNNQEQLYGYDGAGQRIKRTVNGTETWQVYGIGGELLAEYPVNGGVANPQKEYGYRNGQLLIVATPSTGSSHSLSVNGTSAYVQVPNSTSLNITGAITVEAWIKPNAIGSYQYIASRETYGIAGTGGGYELTLNNVGKARFDLYHSHNTYTPVIGSTTLTTGQWHHLAGVWDGTYLRIYVNGVLDGTVTTGNGPASGTSSLKLGRNSGGNYFNGLIDEVRVSNTAVYSSNFTPQMSLSASGSTKGLWKFNGSSVADSSTNGNNGTLQGGATYSTDVPTGPAYHSLSVNGTNAYVQVPTSTSLNITGAITVEAWIKPNSIGAYQYIASRETYGVSGTGGGYELTLNNVGKARFDVYHSHNTYTPVIGSTTLTTGQWYHVAGVWDGTYLRIYVNGVLDGTVTTGNGPASGTSSLKLGRNSGGNYFNGLIDEVRVSNAAVYTTSFTAQTHLSTTANTKALWKFDGQVATDSSTNGNNGTLQGGATYSNDVPSGDGGGGGGGNTPAQTLWLVADHLGTPRIIFDQTGSLAGVKRHDYLPFGEELIAGGRTVAMGYASDGVRQQFTQKERDVETGLDYFFARYYSSIQGRFSSVDPYDPITDSEDEDDFKGYISQPQNWNRYAYTVNNPSNYYDPDGRRWFYKCSGEQGCDVQWVNPNDDGSYTSPGEGWIEFVPKSSGDYLRIVSEDGTTAYHFGERKDGTPFVRELQTGGVQDASWDLVGLFIPSRLGVKGIAATASLLWAKHQAKRAAFEAAVATLSKLNPNQIAKGISAVLRGKQPLNTLSRVEREAAARYYERVAREGTKGKFAEAARRYNLERARYLREGGKVPPGTLREFMQREGLN